MTSQNGKKRTLKILLLSDDKPNQDVIGDALGAIERYAYALDVLPQDNDALAAVATGEHDAILCDLSQPASANRQLRRVLDRRFAATPVIVLARPALAGMRSELQQTGAADVLLMTDLIAPLVRRAIDYAVEFAEMQERLASLALFDEMTGLPNMILFWEFLSYAVKRAQRQEERLAVMGIYISGLADINSSRGREFGDMVLRKVSENIKKAVRTCDAVARFSGTKFVALLEPLGEDENIHIVSERVVEAVATPVEVGGEHITLAATIGVSLYPTSVGSPSALLRNATTAMDYAMERGEGSIYIS